MSNVDWDVARSVAARIGGDDEFGSSYLADSLADDFAELTPQAEELVAAETGFPRLAGDAKARVTDRAGWVDANLAAFERLMRPLFERIDAEAADEPDGPLGRWWKQATELARPVTEPIGATLSGAEAGALLGWMSRRVLGQYDLLITEDDSADDQDWVYYVGPNIVNLEKRFGFPPRQFRLWIAVHECTHRAQFTGIPWLRPYFLSQVEALLDSVDPDTERIVESLKTAVAERRNGTAPSLSDGGLALLFASPEQRETLDRMAGLMSLLEGHGDVTMDRAAGPELIPSQPRFARVMSERRRNTSGINKVVQKLTGMEAKLAQYEEGEHFVHTVEAAGGRELIDQVWVAPENLPDLGEIRDPDRWIERIQA